MPTISRRRLGLLALAAPAILSRPARAAEFSLKFANNVATTHPLYIRSMEAAERVAKATNGRVEIRVFPNSQLGTDTDMLSQLRSGGIDLFTLSGLILSTLVPAASINGIGFAFKDYSQVWSAMDGNLGAFIRTEIGKRGLMVMDKIWDNGFRQTTTSTAPITTAADLRGLKIRVPVSPLWTSMFAAFGASPASINFSEVYSALQTHIVDAQENPLAIINSGKLYEVQTYCSMTNHMWDGFWCLANRRSFGALPADLQAIVARELNQSALDERRDIEALNTSLKDGLAKNGLAFNAVDPVSFRDQLRSAGFYKDWRAKYGEDAWAVLESYTGSLS